MREGYDKWKATLNKYETEELTREYLKENPGLLDYSDMDIWLFEKWEAKNC